MSEPSFVSYPPPFRSSYALTQSPEPDESVEEVLELDLLPMIDMQSLNLQELGGACRDWGLFRLVNHGIPKSLMIKLEECVKELFGMPFESKQGLFTKPISYFWGTPALTSSGVAISRATPDINWVEGFNAPLYQLPQLQPRHPIIDSFRVLLEEYGTHLTRVATTIFGALAMNLNLDPKQSESHLAESTGLVRLYHYPRCSSSAPKMGVNAHTDSSVLSILSQDDVGGLQVLKDEKWFHVKPIPNTLIVNVGDMLQAISDDEYKSVTHRVIANKLKERISVCYFVFPANDTIIQSSRYKPFTYSDFRTQVQEDVRTLGFKVGLQNFRLTGAC